MRLLARSYARDSFPTVQRHSHLRQWHPQPTSTQLRPALGPPRSCLGILPMMGSMSSCAYDIHERLDKFALGPLKDQVWYQVVRCAKGPTTPSRVGSGARWRGVTRGIKVWDNLVEIVALIIELKHHLLHLLNLQLVVLVEVQAFQPPVIASLCSCRVSMCHALSISSCSSCANSRAEAKQAREHHGATAMHAQTQDRELRRERPFTTLAAATNPDGRHDDYGYGCSHMIKCINI